MYPRILVAGIDQSNSSVRVKAISLAVIAVAALAAIAPFAWLGTPSGHDFEFHFNSWIEVVQHWCEGVLYPHWAALAHYGYGEARFIFYPPISWVMGAVLGKVLPWTIVPAAYVWISLTLAGISMYLLAATWLKRWDAVFVAAIYAVNPYNLVVVYWRSALSELLAAAYLPLLFLWALRSRDKISRVVPPLAVLLALGWLTNIPSAVMMHYSLALLVIVIALQHRSWKPLASAALAALFGLALAAVYLVPVLHQQTWVSLSQVFSANVRPADNYLFRMTSDADHNQFNVFISWLAVWEITVTAFALVLWRRRTDRELWWPILAWSAVSSLLMLSITSPLWRHFPELKYVQLPWRWLLCLSVPVSLVFILAFRRWWVRIAIAFLVIAAVPYLSHRVLAPWWDTASDLREMVDNQHEGIGNEGVDEYVPAAADPYAIDQKAPLAAFEGQGSAQIKIATWGSEHRVIAMDSSFAGTLVLRLFNYPLWRVTVNGSPVPSSNGAHGELQVAVPAGENQIEVDFVEGRDREAGAAISLLSLIMLGIWCWLSRQSHSLLPKTPDASPLT